MNETFSEVREYTQSEYAAQTIDASQWVTVSLDSYTPLTTDEVKEVAESVIASLPEFVNYERAKHLAEFHAERELTMEDTHAVLNQMGKAVVSTHWD